MRWLALALLPLFFCRPASAMQEAKVVPATATLYRQVNGKMQPAQQVTAGQVLKVADHEKSGWYACAIPGTQPPKAGWIRASDIALMGHTSASSRRFESSESSPAPRWSVGLVYDAALVSPTQLQAASNLAPNMSLGSSLGIEAERSFFTERLSFGARVDTFLLSGKLVDGNPSGGDLGYSGFAIPITLLARYDFLATSAFRLGIVAGAGISPITTYRVTIGAQTTSATGLALFAPAELEADIRVGSRLLLLIEAGYRVVAPLSSIKVSGITMGSDFSSFLGGAGLRVEF